MQPRLHQLVYRLILLRSNYRHQTENTGERQYSYHQMNVLANAHFQNMLLLILIGIVPKLIILQFLLSYMVSAY
jgi:hypothetical protein